MATVAEPRSVTAPTPQRFLFRCLGWEGYQGMLNILQESHVRLTYDRGDLEIMAPLPIHEKYKYPFGRMIDTLTEELDIQVLAYGSMTIHREEADCGLEPDQCYYLGNIERLRDTDRIDFDVDPAPDLAIEIDITSSPLDRMAIYAALGIPEVWRFDGASFRIAVRRLDGQYAPSETSAAFPALPIAEFVRFASDPITMDGTAWVRAFRAWVREVVVPRHRS